MMSNPLVSAIIPTKNRADMLERALGSVFDQTYKNIEIIVVDDGSTDRTPNLLQAIKASSVFPMTILRNDQSVGAAQARNQAVEAAKGTFIAGLDDDDTWHKNRIAKLVDANADAFAFVTSNVVMAYPKKSSVWKKQKVINFNRLLYSNQVGNQGLIGRDRLLAVGGYDESLAAAQDYDLWVRLSARYGPVKNVQQPLQTVFMDHAEGRITDQSFAGYLQFYHKHKHRFNRAQRKYKLYNIRRAQGKPQSVAEFFSWVPPFRYWKEVKLAIIRHFFE